MGSKRKWHMSSCLGSHPAMCCTKLGLDTVTDWDSVTCHACLNLQAGQESRWGNSDMERTRRGAKR